MIKVLVTQSLLSSYDYIFKSGNQEQSYNDFINTLSKTGFKQNELMLDGIAFEDKVTDYCLTGNIDKEDDWYIGIKGVGDLVQDGQFQVALSKSLIIDDLEVVFYGKLDVLKAGVIRDIKFSKTYHVGKYLDSPQHPIYLLLVPESREFIYTIFTGYEVCEEKYRRDSYDNLEKEIVDRFKEFIKFLKDRNLYNIFLEKWESKF